MASMNMSDAMHEKLEQAKQSAINDAAREEAERRSVAASIKTLVADLNDYVEKAASLGLSTEYLLDAVEEGNAYHQKLRVVVSERL